LINVVNHLLAKQIKQ